MAKQNQEVKVTAADPSALGLFGLAMVTLVASSEKLGWTTGTAGILPWAIFLGACAQIVTCLTDIKRGNVFGTVAFGAYGFFWLAVAMTWMIKGGVLSPVLQPSFDVRQFGFAFLGYLIFTLYMTVVSMETTKVLFIIFVLIDFLFVGLAMVSFSIVPDIGKTIAGWSEFILSMFSFYASAANVMSNVFGRQVLPVGKPFGIFKK